MENNSKSIISIIETIKQDIITTRNKVLEISNTELINLYYKIGKYISENATYGSNFIETLSKSLKSEFPTATGYSDRNLLRMKRFYDEYKDFSNSPLPVANLPIPLAKLPWTHNCILIDKIKDLNIRVWYAEKCLENGWNKVVLEHQIDLELYERQADKTKKLANFVDKLPTMQGELAMDFMKDPYIFELVGIKEKISERNLEYAMLEKIKNVLLELGKGFSFVGNQYKVSTDNKDYYIDLLFYHLNLNCYVVVELKNVDFDPAFVGQLQFYITAVDEILKKATDNPTIGLLLCKNKDKLSVEWALKSTNVPVGVASYEVRQYLPTEEEINKFMNI